MTDEITPPEAELAKLADGSLPADREAQLRAQIGDSPSLADALAEQERAVALLRMVDEPAPASLRARVDALTESGGRRRRRTWRVLALPAATALAVVIAAVVILVGGSSAPALPQATHLALSAATLPAPSVDPSNPNLLRISSDGIPFYNWRGWRPVGARVDTVDGRRVVTVFYKEPDGTRVGYAIAERPPLEHADDSEGYAVSYSLGHQGSARLVTWVQNGRTCVIAGRDVNYPTLLHLARVSSGLATG